jgi:hypothetical protein
MNAPPGAQEAKYNGRFLVDFEESKSFEEVVLVA